MTYGQLGQNLEKAAPGLGGQFDQLRRVRRGQQGFDAAVVLVEQPPHQVLVDVILFRQAGQRMARQQVEHQRQVAQAVVRLDDDHVFVHALAQGDGQVGSQRRAPDAPLETGQGDNTAAALRLAPRAALHRPLYGSHKLDPLDRICDETGRAAIQGVLQLDQMLRRDQDQQRQVRQAGGHIAQQRDGVGQVQIH